MRSPTGPALPESRRPLCIIDRWITIHRSSPGTSILVIILPKTMPMPDPQWLRYLRTCLLDRHGEVSVRMMVDQQLATTWHYRLDGPWSHPAQVHHTLAEALSHPTPSQKHEDD